MVIYLQPVYLKVFLRRNVIKTMFLVCSKRRLKTHFFFK